MRKIIDHIYDFFDEMPVLGFFFLVATVAGVILVLTYLGL